MTQRFSRIFELNLSISLLQVLLTASARISLIKMDKQKQHFSEDEDFEVEKKPRMCEGAAAASTQKKKTDPDPSKPKMCEGAAAASMQKKKDPSKKQPR